MVPDAIFSLRQEPKTFLKIVRTVSLLNRNIALKKALSKSKILNKTNLDLGGPTVQNFA